MKQLNSKMDPNGETNLLLALFYEKKETEFADVLEKVIITNLITKLEVFFESRTQNFFAKLKEIENLTTADLPSEAKEAILRQTYETLKKDLECGKIPYDHKKTFRNFSIFMEEGLSLEVLEVDLKIKLNGTGTDEFRKLLERIGIPNFFESFDNNCSINLSKNRGLSVKVNSKVESKGMLDRFISMRHLIVHEDRLAVISESDLEDFIDLLNEIGNYVDTLLEGLYEQYRMLSEQRGIIIATEHIEKLNFKDEKEDTKTIDTIKDTPEEKSTIT